jgi:hypothetical protein
MPTYRYVGPHPEVEVPSLGAVVKNGATVEVADSEAAGFEGQSVWEHVKQPTAKRALASEQKDED